MKNRLYLAVCIFAASVPAIGQTKKDMAQMAAVATPGTQHKLLGALAGNWTSTVDYIIGGRTYKGSAKMQAEMILGGRFLRMEYTSSMNGVPLTILEHLGYDNATGKYSESLMTTSSTSAYLATGSVGKDGKTITTLGTMTEPGVRGPVRLRIVTSIVDATRFNIDWYQTLPGKPEAHTVSIVNKRV